MKRVLIITYYWPPSGGAGVQRWLKFSKFLPEFGWQPIIYTPENPEAPIEDHSLLNDIRETTTDIKRNIWEPYQFYKKFLGLRPEQKINAGFLSETEKPGLKEKVSVWIRGNLFIPDARKFWIKPSAKFLIKYLQSHPVDAIVSTGPPHSMHLIASKVAQKTGVPWLADFRDPWTGIDFYQDLLLTKNSDKKHRRLEKMVLQQANAVTVVGKTMANEFHQIAGIEAFVIPNGYDEDDFSETDTKPQHDFTLLHIGAMNKDRNHEIFWKAMSEMIKQSKYNNLKIKLIGKLDISVLKSIKTYRLKENVIPIPYLPHNLISKELQAAAVLYLPINNTPNSKAIQTGKLFEYLAAGRPILGIGPEDGDAAEIINMAKAGTMIDYQKKDLLKEFIEICFSDWKKGKKSKTITGNTKLFSRKNLTEKLALQLDLMLEN